MATTPVKTTDKPIAPKVRQMVSMLVVQFLAGMGLNLIGEPDSSSTIVKKLAADGIFAVHVVNGLGLLILGLWLLKITMTSSDTWLKMKLRVGFAGVLLAFAGGVLTVSVKSLDELFSFFMAAFFLLAIMTYGSLYAKLSAGSATKTS